MKKLCLYLVVLSTLLLSATNRLDAQLKRPGIIVGGNVLYAAPKGSFANSYKGGVGGEIFAGLGLGKTYLVGTLGYSHFAARSGEGNGSITYKPMKFGIKQFILGRQIFLNADVGTGSIKDKSMTGAESRFIRGFGGGARLAGMEASVYYDGWKNKNSSGFSNSLQFKLGWNITI